MNELLPVAAGFVLVFLWPRSSAVSGLFLVLSVLLGALCSYINDELVKSLGYAAVDAVTTYCTFVAVRLVVRHFLPKLLSRVA